MYRGSKSGEQQFYTKPVRLGDDGGLMRIHRLSLGKAQRTDTTNAERLVAENEGTIRYNVFWKKWLVWNGRFWKTDEGDVLIHGKGLQMIRNLQRDALDTEDSRERLEIEKFAAQSESMRRRNACIEAASKIEAVQVNCDELDRDEFLLTVENGTVNLVTGEFREHRPGDLITKMARVAYDPQAQCPAWEQFVREIMNYDGELIRFLQTAAGWGITGNTSEQVMFILFGCGANGKSTFLNTVLKLLGDYATTTPTETFMRPKNEKMSNDIARLRGTRFVTTTEAEQGERLSERLIKQITGQDPITARFLYGEFFSFVPSFKIFFATNHKPVIKGSDHGIWRRIMLIPFTTTILKEKQDKELERKLLAEGPGILNWLIEGARRWKAEGLVVPPSIANATDEYRGEMDVIGNFIKECCLPGEDTTVRVRELFRTYQEWCAESNERGTSERYFGLRLKEMGYKQTRTREARYWTGLSLKPAAA